LRSEFGFRFAITASAIVAPSLSDAMNRRHEIDSCALTKRGLSHARPAQKARHQYVQQWERPLGSRVLSLKAGDVPAFPNFF
jgi:hypothetical protein